MRALDLAAAHVDVVLPAGVIDDAFVNNQLELVGMAIDEVVAELLTADRFAVVNVSDDAVRVIGSRLGGNRRRGGRLRGRDGALGVGPRQHTMANPVARAGDRDEASDDKPDSAPTASSGNPFIANAHPFRLPVLCPAERPDSPHEGGKI